MSKSTSTSKKKKTPKIELTGKVYRYDDVSHLSPIQQAHRRGEIDVYSPIQQADGEPLPSLADQWKEDWTKRYGKSSRNR